MHAVFPCPLFWGTRGGGGGGLLGHDVTGYCVQRGGAGGGGGGGRLACITLGLKWMRKGPLSPPGPATVPAATVAFSQSVIA